MHLSIPRTCAILAFAILSLLPSVPALADPATIPIFFTGDPVPGAGVTGSGVPSGAVWTGFGSPCVDEAYNITFIGKYKSGTAHVTAIFSGSLTNFSSLGQRARVGDPAYFVYGSHSSVVYRSFSDPFLVGKGKIAFLAKVGVPGQPAVTGVFTNAFEGYYGNIPSPFSSLIRVGDGDTLNTVVKSITSVIGLSDQNGFTFVVAGTDSDPVAPKKVWYLNAPSGPGSNFLYSVFNSGDPIYTGAVSGGNEAIKSTTLLKSHAGSPAQGHDGLVDINNNTDFSFKVTTASGTGIGNFEACLDFFQVAHFTKRPETILGESLYFTSFGQPTLTSEGYLAWVGTFKGAADITSANNTGIFLDAGFTDSGSPTLIAQKGNTVSGLPSTITLSSFKDPIPADNGRGAFLATIVDKVNLGTVTSANNLCLLDFSGNLLARKGAQAPDAPVGANFASISSVVFPTGAYGPAFVASLVKNVAGIDATNATGIWGVTDAFGTVDCLMRQGDNVSGKILKSFVTLKASAGTPAQPREYTNKPPPFIFFNASFTDHTSGLVALALPTPTPN